MGIDEPQMVAMRPGLSVAQIEAWTDFDNVNDLLARYSDPAVAIRLHPFELSSGAKVVVIAVYEFEDVPHICKRDYERELQRESSSRAIRSSILSRIHRAAPCREPELPSGACGPIVGPSRQVFPTFLPAAARETGPT